MIGEVKRGDVVYVRMVVNNLIEETDALQCRVFNPVSGCYAFVPVPKGQVVAIEPDVMEAADGIVRGIEFPK